MSLALGLAKRGMYTTTPNPRVGCVIVNASGEVVGKGAHLKAGEPHAEVFALREAAEKAAGATAYVTLEPCSHTGRTPPCADALIKANVSRVVIANVDPNPSVDGGGIAKLKKAGIEVQTGILDKQASALNKGFFKRMRSGLPYTRIKLAASIDAKTALSNGVSQWITGPEARQDVQRYRASSCVVLTGAGTVLADNPSLLVREEQAQLDDYPDLPLRQPLRVVVQGKRELPSHLQLFTDGQRTHVIHTEDRAQRDTLHSEQAHYSEYICQETNKCSQLRETFLHLGKQSYNDAWVEAGARLSGAIIEAGLADELIVYLAPKLLGNASKPLLNLPEYEKLNQVPQLSLQDCSQVGSDVRLTYTFNK